MAGSPQSDIDILEKHLQNHAKSLACIVCGAKDWGVVSDTALPIHEVDRYGQALSGPECVPLASLVCEKCFYVMSFAAKPIRNASSDAG